MGVTEKVPGREAKLQTNKGLGGEDSGCGEDQKLVERESKQGE